MKTGISTGKRQQFNRGVRVGCSLYLLLVLFVIPWTFAVFGPRTDGALFTSSNGQGPGLQVFIYYSLPFVLAFLAAVVGIYFQKKASRPVFAKSLLVTTLVGIGLHALLMVFLTYLVYF